MFGNERGEPVGSPLFLERPEFSVVPSFGLSVAKRLHTLKDQSEAFRFSEISYGKTE